MDEKKLKALAAELANGLKTEADLNQFSRMLTKLTVETALNAGLTDHLGHEKNVPKKVLTPAMATHQKRCFVSQKESLGMWLAENAGAKFWLNVLTELKNRGLQDILIACVDGLKGFPDAINSAYLINTTVNVDCLPAGLFILTLTE